MLNTIREKHSKQILWAITIVIVFTFGLGSAVTYIKSKQNPVIGKIDNHKIYASDAEYYSKMLQAAKIMATLNTKSLQLKSLEELKQPGEYLLLLWKANKEKITVSEKELVKPIKGWFSINNKFDKAAYTRFLDYGIRMQPSRFEEYVSNLIKIEKLYNSLPVPAVTDEEVRSSFIKDTQKAKIDYLVIPFDDKQENNDKAMEEANLLSEKIKNNEIKSLKNIKLQTGWELTESKEFREDDYIEGIGLDMRLNGMAFSLEKGQVSSEFLLLPKGIYFIQLIDKTPIDEEKFNKNKEDYRNFIKEQKLAQEQEGLIEKITSESKFEVFESIKEPKKK